MIRIGLLIAFYIFSFLNIALMLKFFRLTSRPDFRDDYGDVTTEVGYEEDSFGNVVNNDLPLYPVEKDGEKPHVVYEPMTGGHHEMF